MALSKDPRPGSRPIAIGHAWHELLYHSLSKVKLTYRTVSDVIQDRHIIRFLNGTSHDCTFPHDVSFDKAIWSVSVKHFGFEDGYEDTLNMLIYVFIFCMCSQQGSFGVSANEMWAVAAFHSATSVSFNIAAAANFAQGGGFLRASAFKDTSCCKD